MSSAASANLQGLSRLGLPMLAVCIALALFQTGAALAKSLFPIIGAEAAATLRLGIGAMVLLAILRPWRRWPKNPPILATIAVGLAMSGAVGFFYLAIQTLPLGIAIPIQFLGPLGLAIFHSRRPSDFAWVALAAAGIWLMTGGTSGGLHFDLLGIVYSLLAAASWAAYIQIGPRVSSAFGIAGASLAASIAALVWLPFGVAEAGMALLDPAILPLALLVALMSTVLPFSLEFYALPRLPSRLFAIMTSFEPIFAGITGYLMLGERLSASQLIGVLCVMVAAMATAWTSARTPAAVQAAAPIE